MNAKQIILSIAITIVFAMFIGYGVETFYHSPEYNDFCEEDYWQYHNKTSCENSGGEWRNYDHDDGNCETPESCQEAYDEADEKYSGVFFLTSIISGLIAIVLGIFILKGAVSSGLLGGGTLIIFIGSTSYWEYANDVIKFIALGLVLAVMIYLGNKYLDKRSKKK